MSGTPWPSGLKARPRLPVGTPLRERLLYWVEMLPDAPGCWLWLGNIVASGALQYGRLSVEGVRVLAHRAAYEEFRGPLPDGAHALHSCDVALCINPWHQFPGSHLDNMRDCARKGRTARGERHGSWLHPELTPRGEGSGNAVLSQGQVEDIRAIAVTRAVTNREMAGFYGVSESMVGMIVNRKRWRHVA